MQPEIAGLPYLLGDVVADNIRWAPSEPALIFGDRTRSWTEFGADMARIQQGLTALGIGHGSRALPLLARWLPTGLLDKVLKKRFGLDGSL